MTDSVRRRVLTFMRRWAIGFLLLLLGLPALIVYQQHGIADIEGVVAVAGYFVWTCLVVLAVDRLVDV